MKRTLFVISSSLVLFLSSCSDNQISSEGTTDVNKFAMDKFISSGIQGKERETMRSLLAVLPEHARTGYVAFIDESGKVHGNTPEAEQVTYYSPTENPNVFVSKQGEKEYFPNPEPTPEPELSPQYLTDDWYRECKPGAGAYRRMLTKQGGVGGPYGSSTRYSYIRAVFGVRGGSTSSIRTTDKNNTVAYAFLGGNGTNKWTVDAGLQYGSTYKDWALFLRTEQALIKSQGRGLEKLRFAPDQPIEVEFFVVQDARTIDLNDKDNDNDNVIAVIARGKNIRDRKMQSVTFVYDVPQKGWYKDGNDRGHGINLKQTVSLAQIRPNFNDGSYFRGTTITGTMVGSSFSRRRALASSDVGKICATPASRVSVVGGAINISY